MENQNHCFVVMYLTGEYESQIHIPCAVFMNQKEAENYINDRNLLLGKLGLCMVARGKSYPEQYESQREYAEAMTVEHGFPHCPDYNGAMYFLYSSSEVEFYEGKRS